MKDLADRSYRPVVRAVAASLGQGAGSPRATIDLRAVKAAYRRYARVYDTIFGRALRAGRLAAVAAANTGPNQRILEIGVGTGLSLDAYRADAKVVGIDVCEEMLERARRRVRRLGLAQVEALAEMDAQEIAYPDASFDAVVALYVMTVVPDVKRVAAEMRRVCKPGGCIVVVNHLASDHFLLRRMELALTRMAGQLGFRADLDLAQLGQAMRLPMIDCRPAKLFGLFGLWRLVQFRNDAPAGQTERH